MATVKPRRPCAHPGCREWATKGSYCSRHAAEWEAKLAERRAAFAARADNARPSADARGYTSAWRKARKAYIIRHPLCAICGAPATDVDHIIPHRGDKELFWDSGNWQSLCHECHSRKSYGERRNTGRKKPESDPDMGIMIIP